MEEKELIEKLNSVSRINMENPGHRVKLRIALLTAHEKIRESQKISSFAWKIIPASAFALMFLILGISHDSSLLLKSIGTVSEAKQILEYDGQTRSLINSGAIIEDTEIIGNRAYILMQLPEIITFNSLTPNKTTASTPTLNAESDYHYENSSSTGGGIYLVEINMTDKKVTRIEKKPEGETLIESNSQQVVNETVGQRGGQVGQLLSEELVNRIEIVRPGLRLIKKDNEFDLMPGSEQMKDIYLIYEQGGKQLKEKIETILDK